MDAWIPELAPGHVLRRRREAGVLSWKSFRDAYRSELRSTFALNLLKPLGLLSRRRLLVLLCDCPAPRRCHHRILARVLEKCRAENRFALSLGPSTVAGRPP